VDPGYGVDLFKGVIYVYRDTFDNPQGYLLSAVEQFLALYAFFDFVGTTGVLSASVSDFIV
jgi:hypothetical protein